MTRQTENSLARSALMTAWGMATLVLLFCVIFLVYEIVQRGQNPGVNTLLRISSPHTDNREGAPSTTRDIQLYFATADGSGLTPESRRIEIGSSTVENVRRALNALIEGPRDVLTPVLPPSTKLRGLYLLAEGELVIDFTRDLEAGHIKSAWAELLMVRSIVSSAIQPALNGRGAPPLTRVRFLFEGSPPQDTFPAHIDLTDPVYPDRAWIAAPSEG